MHDIEPYYRWRSHYIASEDERSPFYGRSYSEFTFSHKVYNYFIHPQWDEMGSSTLYLKIIYVDYQTGSAIIEFIGEWNDCIENDFYILKTQLLEQMMSQGIHRYIFICENVMNYHGGDNDYYAEWSEELWDEQGWVVYINPLPHVREEMYQSRLQDYVTLPPTDILIPWRKLEPHALIRSIEDQRTGYLTESQHD